MYLKKELYALIQSDESIFDFIQESSLDGLWYWDLENIENEWMNAKFWTVLGYNPDEMPHKSAAWQSIINQEDLKVANDNFTKHCNDSNHPYDQVVRYTHKNGSTVWIRCRGLAIRNKDGKPIRMLGAHQDVTELKRREQELYTANHELLESKEKYLAFYNNAPLSFQSLDENGSFLDINPMWLRTLGYERDEVIGKWYGDFLHPDYVEHFRNNFPAFKRLGSISDVQFKLRRKDNTYIHVSFEGCIGYTPEGKFKQTYCVFKDITEQKALENAIIKAKEKAERNERELLKAQGIAHVGSWYLNLETNEVVWTEEMYKMYGYDPAMPPPTFAEHKKLFTPESWKILSTSLAKTIESGITYELELRTVKKDGSNGWVWVQGEAVKDKNNTIVGFWGAAQDITQRKQADEALRKSEEKAHQKDIEFRKLSSHLPDLIYQFRRRPDGSYCVPIASEGIKNIFGCSPEDVINDFAPISKVIYPDDAERVIKEIEYSAKHLTYFTCEFRVQIQGKPLQWILSRSTPEKQADGSITWYGFNANITERKHAEIELTLAKEKAEESDRLKSAFLSNMSHEIRTPMNGILGFANLLKEPGLTGDVQQEYIKLIEKSGARMLNIIKDIVDISKIESGIIDIHLSETNINNQLQFVYDSLKFDADNKKLNLSFNCALPEKEVIVKTDIEKLYGILTNLVKNAIKFTDTGTIEFGYNNTGEEFEFYVTDTGIGIPKEKQEAIFERFIQANIVDKMARQGAGLGLAISRAYVEMLGGKIWVESEEGKGSTFYFTLPSTTQLTAETINNQPTPSEKINDVRKLKILIAEDDEVSEKLIGIFIRSFGYDVLKARTGVEAIEICRTTPDIDLILMDIRMPDMGGYAATKQIRKFNKEVIIIAQTAYGLSGDREKSIKAGCNDYIAKPIEKGKLNSLIQKYFKRELTLPQNILHEPQ